jgi:hypothetical protein
MATSAASRPQANAIGAVLQISAHSFGRLYAAVVVEMDL